jgi:hypothetical protein
MMELSTNESGLTTLHVSGVLKHADYEFIVPQLEQLLAQGTTRILLDIEGFKAVTPPALVDELKFDIRHRKDFDKIAVVGDSLDQLGISLVAPIFSGELKMFGPLERAAAEDWLRQD